MRLNEIPLSRSEAWRLYNKGLPVIEFNSVAQTKLILNPANKHGFDVFLEEGKRWHLQLTKEDTVPFINAAKWRVWQTIYILYAGGAGFTLFSFWYLTIPSIRFSSTELLIYSQLLLVSSCYFLAKVLESFDIEKKLWNEMYEKYNVSDWKDMWG